MTKIRFEHVSKQYEAGVYALAGLNLDVEPAELVSLVGPSGSGKTTALRILAGLEPPSHGHVLMDGAAVDHVPTRLRGLGLVTQENALLAHRSAQRNIAFPLELRPSQTRESIDAKVDELASELEIGHLLKRKPRELSAGETQAVQIARALISLPDVWLLDEPLGGLDPGLRRSLRLDIMRLRSAQQVTAVLATADQGDATLMSDRIAMLLDGRLQQTGTPSDLHDSPVNTAVARFFGEPAMNLVPARVEGAGRERTYRLLGIELPAWPEVTARYAGREILVGFRAADVDAAATAPRAPRFAARVVRVDRLGSHAIAHLDAGSETHLRWVASGPGPATDERVDLVVAPDRFHLFDPLTRAAVWHPSAPRA